MKLTTILFAACLCLQHFTQATSSKGRKITFATTTDASDEVIDYNDSELPSVNSEEYYEDYRWVAVTSEGYEYEGTLEEAKALLNDEPATQLEEMVSDEGNDEPATSPSKLAEEDEEDDIDSQDTNAPSSPDLESENTEAEVDADSTDDEVASDEADDADDQEKANSEKVFGRDSRVKVRRVWAYPWRTIGRIDTGCTGTMIGRRTVLTAGHCVHNGRAWYSNVHFRRRKNCNPNRGILMPWVRAVTYNGWIRSRRRNFNIAIIIVRGYSPSPYMPLTYSRSSRRLRRSTVTIAGYPGEKCGKCMWQTHCRISRAYSSQLLYRCDTSRGMGGSAVYLDYRRYGRRRICGVHTHPTRRYNRAVRITRYHYRNIRSWIRTYRG